MRDLCGLDGIIQDNNRFDNSWLMMKERKETISIVKANVWSMVLLLAAGVVFGILFIIGVKCFGIEARCGKVGALVLMLSLLPSIVAHELIHGITWALFAKRGFRAISFGVIWKYLTPYCHCDEPLTKLHYMLGAFMPCLLLGIVPAVLSVVLGLVWLYLFGVIFISAAAGDLMVMWRLRKEKPAALVLDHPSEAGYLVYEEEEANVVTNKE